MSEKANDEAVSLAEAKTELMEGPDKEEMEALLDDSRSRVRLGHAGFEVPARK